MDDSSVTRVVVRSAHQPPDRPPLNVVPGEVVRVGGRDTEWAEFVFVTIQRGAGWVPARYLSAPAGEATVLKPYDTTELATEAGDVLEVVIEDLQSGWLWCRSSDGRKGWVPARTVDRSS
jgi:hypothetical protein